MYSPYITVTVPFSVSDFTQKQIVLHSCQIVYFLYLFLFFTANHCRCPPEFLFDLFCKPDLLTAPCCCCCCCSLIKAVQFVYVKENFDTKTEVINIAVLVIVTVAAVVLWDCCRCRCCCCCLCVLSLIHI